MIPIVHLERLGSLPEETVRFYMAQLSSALSFLHDMGIMHRCICISALGHLLVRLMQVHFAYPGILNPTTSSLTNAETRI